eukprot:RCo045122
MAFWLSRCLLSSARRLPKGFGRMIAQQEASQQLKYVGPMFRPPSEAQSFLLQATIGCSWNACTYCLMYRSKRFRTRPIEEVLADLRKGGEQFGGVFEKMFVTDGDALVMEMPHWRAILPEAHRAFPGLKQVSCYATARNVLGKSAEELAELRKGGLSIVYMGPESGDDEVLKQIVKGGTFEEHQEAGKKLKAAGIKNSCIFLLGVGGVARSKEHAIGSAKLATAMDPEYISALTVEVLPGTPIEKFQKRNKFVMPTPMQILEELRTFVTHANPTHAVFRTNHASNYLPLMGNLPSDRERLLQTLELALAGKIQLRPEEDRAL